MSGKVYRQLWVLVSYCEAFDGTPQFVAAGTKGGQYPSWTNSPREAKQFQSRQAAHQFLRRLDCYYTFPQNLAAYGFAG